jgi:hypothetical protein
MIYNSGLAIFIKDRKARRKGKPGICNFLEAGFERL